MKCIFPMDARVISALRASSDALCPRMTSRGQLSSALLNGRDAGFHDDVAPFGRLGGDELGELLGSGGNAFGTLLDDLRGYRWIVDGGDQLLIELGDDRRWRPMGRQQCEPSRCLVVLDPRFRDRGNVGKRGHALARR